MSSPLPKITINIVAYNQEAVIGETIESALQQTYPNTEILIADDCSPDGTLDICRAYQKKYPDKIRILPSANNMGLPANASKGIHEMAKDAEYYSVFAGDDLMLPHHIEILYNTLKDNPAAVMAHSNALWFQSETGEIIKKHHKSPVKETSLRKIQTVNIVCTPCSMIRKRYLPVGFRQDASATCDWIYFAEILKHGKGIYVDECTVKYRRHDENISNNPRMNYITIDALNKMSEYGIPLFPEINLGYALQYRALVKKSFLNKDFKKVALYFYRFCYHHTKFAFLKIREKLSEIRTK